jgi:hypothetical protein
MQKPDTHIIQKTDMVQQEETLFQADRWLCEAARTRFLPALRGIENASPHSLFQTVTPRMARIALAQSVIKKIGATLSRNPPGSTHGRRMPE